LHPALDAMAPDDRSKMGSGSTFRSFTHNDHSTSRWRRNRSSASVQDHFVQPAPVPLDPNPAPKLDRTPSKMSLFNLFSKPKVEKARGHSEVGLAVPMAPPVPPKHSVSPPKSALRHNPPPPVQQALRSRSSQMLRPISLRPSIMRPQEGTWNPPPLFQAYPQSIKYATVQSCVFSPDVLLRTQSQRKQLDMARERMDSHRDLSSTLEGGSPEPKKLEKSHKRLISNSVLHTPPPQLTDKVYVLVTAGYVLQYAGEGSFDRLPEKVLKLGKESKAYACDLIPGKHFVLQVSQSANEDGTVSMGPKTSLLSRLRLQNATARRAATSFLLVLENAEEMDSWMTAVRREIERAGGAAVRDESISIRESSSIDESPDEEQAAEREAESPSPRYHVRRDPQRVSKVVPVDSPLQSQYSDSPKIVASDWEGDRSEKTVSIADTASLHSNSRMSSKRKSIEVSSIATTAVSHDQLQLDQLRERSRFSYMSSATSVSGAGTRNTSRTSSPAPTSPLKEGFSPADAEPLRSATSLRSFHMNPSNSTSTRRRSMQPLPTTNEDNAVSAVTPSTPKRHSIYGPTSPTTKEPEKPESEVQESKLTTTPPQPATRPASNVRYSTVPPQTQLPAKFNLRSSSAPPARLTAISPPPRDPAPGPPARPQSTLGSLPSAAALSTRSERRISATPKPFLRPFPVRTQHSDGSVVVPRRLSSMSTGPPLGIVVNRSVTAPVRPPAASNSTSPPIVNISPLPSQTLRRPSSVQIRSDPAPFLSSSRPVRAISSTPSFVPGRRASATPTPTSNLHTTPSIPVLRQQAQQQMATQKGITPRRSMPAIGLPPPAPPPTMPLPPPPP
ncbi:hypothetical protein BS50DRAFT_463994, partial [Corynespora cassiicola Philippines]